MKIKDTFELRGNWWLPEDSKKVLYGQLSFSQEEGAILELDGVFGENDSNRILQPKLILGESQKGYPMTLFKNNIRKWTYPILSEGSSEYRAQIIFNNVHFNNESDIKFHKIIGHFSDLNAWVDKSGISIVTKHENGKYESDIHFHNPESIVYKINDQFEVGVAFSSQGPETKRVQNEVRITQNSNIFIKFINGDIFFDQIFPLLNQFSTLHQLATQRISYPLEIYGFSEANKEAYQDGSSRYPEINIFYSPIEPYKELKPIYPEEMLFTFNDLDEKKIIKWFTLSSIYLIPINLFKSLFYNDRFFIESRFLAITQVLESFHSIKFGNTKISIKIFRDQLSSVIDSIPDQYKKWARQGLSNANYIPFKDRIYELISMKKELFKDVIWDNENFSKRVRDSRNEFVHHSKNRLTFKDPEELYSSILLMKYIFEIYLLEEIGFPGEFIDNLYKKRFKEYSQRWRVF
jgi:hypothetical protein